MIEVEIQIKPMTVNQAWQGRRFKTKNYNVYGKDVLMLLPKRQMIVGAVMIDYIFGIKHMATSDVDNFIKPITDFLVKKGYIQDDRFVMKVSAEKVKSEIPFIKIKIAEI